MTVVPESKLVSYLTDVHSIEEQALAQMRKAPDLAGDPAIARVFSEHIAETERHEKAVAARLAAHGADPSTTKDVIAKVGAAAMLLFARLNPDTPGKLVVHAYSYEHRSSPRTRSSRSRQRAPGMLRRRQRSGGSRRRSRRWANGSPASSTRPSPPRSGTSPLTT